LAALASAGFYAVAPDLRGFGATESPKEVASFDCDAWRINWDQNGGTGEADGK